MAEWGPSSARGPELPRAERPAEPFVCAVCGPTSCPFSLVWGRERFQPAHSSKEYPDCSDGGGPGTHSTGGYFHLSPPVLLIGEGRRVMEAPSFNDCQPLPSLEGTSEPYPLSPVPHTHTLLFGLCLKAVGIREVPVSSFLKSRVLPKEGRSVSADWYN